MAPLGDVTGRMHTALKPVACGGVGVGVSVDGVQGCGCAGGWRARMWVCRWRVAWHSPPEVATGGRHTTGKWLPVRMLECVDDPVDSVKGESSGREEAGHGSFSICSKREAGGGKPLLPDVWVWMCVDALVKGVEGGWGRCGMVPPSDEIGRRRVTAKTDSCTGMGCALVRRWNARVDMGVPVERSRGRAPPGHATGRRSARGEDSY